MGTGWFLFGAGVVGGIVNALAGGATLITFPVMLATGLPAVIANASNAVAIAPGHLLAAWADRDRLDWRDRHLWAIGCWSVAGGGMGAALLLALPERLFLLPIPALIGLATALFAFAPRIAAWSCRWQGTVRHRSERLILLLATLYGGFFGAGLGIILTAVLTLGEPDDIRKVKVLKNVLATAVSLSAIVIFIVRGVVAWGATLPMLLGALLGGYAGGQLIRTLPALAVRTIVIVAGILMTAIYARRYWF